MSRTLLALAFAVVPQIALAQPPATGSTHTFYDPVFTGTVFCDTLEQVRHIAMAEAPTEIFRDYLLTVNDYNEPTCAVIVPTGIVVDVRPLGVMRRDGLRFNAWAIETRVGALIGFALYLEHFEMVIA